MTLDPQRWLYDPLVSKLVFAAVGLIAVFLAVKSLQRATGHYVTSAGARYRVRKLMTFIGYLAASLVLLGTFSDKLGSLTVAFGVAGAGIAFALQEVIASVAGWFALTFGGFFKTGDRVQLGGIVGDVIDIGVIRTTLFECGQWVNGDLYTGRVVRVANSFVLKEPVYNYSGEFPFLWDEITVPVRHGDDIELARTLLQGCAQEVLADYAASAKDAWATLLERYPIEEARIDPMLTLVANDNWVEFTLRYVVDYRRRRATKDVLFTRILRAFAETGGKVQFASATFELVGAPALAVDLRAGGSHGPPP
jgi:small-conductance mechanosensitive channel